MPVKLNALAPKVGDRVSVLCDDKRYYDGIVTSLLRGNHYKVQFEDSTAKNEEVTVHVNNLDRPLVAGVNERFSYFKDLTSLIIEKKLKSLFVSGEGGIGKSYTISEMLEYHDFKEIGDVDTTKAEPFHYIHIKGYTTARALFNALRDNSDKLFIFDDCDSALTDVTAQNIMKAVLDTYQLRRVQWRTNKDVEIFDFTGSVIFLSNKNRQEVNQTILSRSVVIDLFMTPEEKIERMKFLLPTLMLEGTEDLTLDQRYEVLDVIDKYKHTLADLNLRTLVKGLVVYGTTSSIELVRYQILNG